MEFMEFVRLVKHMQACQDRYFALRRQDNARQDDVRQALLVAKDFEKRVKKAIRDIEDGQRSLFDK